MKEDLKRNKIRMKHIFKTQVIIQLYNKTKAEYPTKESKDNNNTSPANIDILVFFSAASKNTIIEFVGSALILQTRIPAISSMRPHFGPKICNLP